MYYHSVKPMSYNVAIMDSYHNQVNDIMVKYARLPFNEDNRCNMLRELRSIVDNAKFDLVPQYALPFPITFRVDSHKYLIDVNCNMYVEI